MSLCPSIYLSVWLCINYQLDAQIIIYSYNITFLYMFRAINAHLQEVTPSPDAKAKGGRGQQASRGHRPRWPSRLNESPSALISRAHFGYSDWGFLWFSSVLRHMPGFRIQSRGTARIHSTPQARRLHLSACKMSLLRLSHSGLRTRTANQAKFIPPTIRVVPPRR